MVKFTDSHKKEMFKSASDLLVKGVNDILVTLVKKMIEAHGSLLQVCFSLFYSSFVGERGKKKVEVRKKGGGSLSPPPPQRGKQWRKVVFLFPPYKI